MGYRQVKGTDREERGGNRQLAEANQMTTAPF